MPGRSCRCLLATVPLILSPFLYGQSGRQSPAEEHQAALARAGEVRSSLSRLPVSPVGFGFAQMSRAAGMIFSGRVTAIARPTRRHAVETVAITFHVEQAIRGATPGDDITISQWIGVWSSGQRYRVGERALLFLYPPSKLGLTSCVGGPLGRFELDPWGRVLLSAHHLSAFRADPVLSGKSVVRFNDFARAARQADEEESAQ